MAIDFIGKTYQQGKGIVVEQSKAATNRTREYLHQKGFGGRGLSQTKTEEEDKSSFQRVGYLPDSGEVPPEYLVEIKSHRERRIVVGILQGNVQQRVESHWAPFIPTSISANIDSVVQAITSGKYSLLTRAATRRMWRGTTPLEISFNLRFEAIENAWREVVTPCKVLQKMSLPGETQSIKNLQGFSIKDTAGLPILLPPGPTPFTYEDVLNFTTNEGTRKERENKVVEGLGGGDIIEVKIGKFQVFYNVIMKTPTVEFHNKPTKEGHPISADVNLRIETYETLTTDQLEEIYQENSLKKQ